MTRQEFLEKYKAEFGMDKDADEIALTESVNIFNAILKNLNRLFDDDLLDYNIYSSNINTYTTKWFYLPYDKFHEFDESTGGVRRINVDEREGELHDELSKRAEYIIEGMENNKFPNIAFKDIKNEVPENIEFDLMDKHRVHPMEIMKYIRYDVRKDEYDKIARRNRQGRIPLFKNITDTEAELYLLLRRVIPRTRGITDTLKLHKWEIIPEADRNKIIKCLRKMRDNGKRSITEDVCTVISFKLKYPNKYRCLIAKKRIERFLYNYRWWLNNIKEYRKNYPDTDVDTNELITEIVDLKSKVLALGDSISKFRDKYYEKEKEIHSTSKSVQDDSYENYENSFYSKMEVPQK